MRRHGGRRTIRGLKRRQRDADKISMKAILVFAVLLGAAFTSHAQGLADVSAAMGVGNALAGTSAGTAHTALDAARRVSSGGGAAWEAGGEAKGGGAAGWQGGAHASAQKGGASTKSWQTARSGGSRGGGGWATNGTPHR